MLIALARSGPEIPLSITQTAQFVPGVFPTWTLGVSFDFGYHLAVELHSSRIDLELQASLQPSTARHERNQATEVQIVAAEIPSRDTACQDREVFVSDYGSAAPAPGCRPLPIDTAAPAPGE